MNRREFIRILSAATMVPMIGLPAVVPGAPAVCFTHQEAIDLGWEILQEIEEKEGSFESYLARNDVGFFAYAKGWHV